MSERRPQQRSDARKVTFVCVYAASLGAQRILKHRAQLDLLAELAGRVAPRVDQDEMRVVLVEVCAGAWPVVPAAGSFGGGG